MALVTPSKYPNSVLVTVPSWIKAASSRLLVERRDCLEERESVRPLISVMARSSVVMVACFELICVCKSPSVVVTLVAKLAELSNAAANSLKVSSADGALFTKLETAEATNAVVAICVVLVPLVAVGASGVPVKVGEARVAYIVLILVPFCK